MDHGGGPRSGRLAEAGPLAPSRQHRGGGIHPTAGVGRARPSYRGGRGGMPVVERDGKLVGVEAVVDKDLSAARLAECVKASVLVFLTDVEQVFLDYGTERQSPLASVTADEAENFLENGQFPPGTHGGQRSRRRCGSCIQAGKALIPDHNA